MNPYLLLAIHQANYVMRCTTSVATASVSGVVGVFERLGHDVVLLSKTRDHD